MEDAYFEGSVMLILCFFFLTLLVDLLCKRFNCCKRLNICKWGFGWVVVSCNELEFVIGTIVSSLYKGRLSFS